MAGIGAEVVATYVDDGYSGTTLNRPGLDELRDAAEAGVFDELWCLSPDRLAGSFPYQVLILDELARLGVSVRFTDSPPIEDDPQARLLIQMQGVIAEYERAKLTERARRASYIGCAPVKRCSAESLTGIAAFLAVPPAQPIWSSTSPRRRWHGASSTSTSRVPPCARSPDASTTTACPPPPAYRCGRHHHLRVAHQPHLHGQSGLVSHRARDTPRRRSRPEAAPSPTGLGRGERARHRQRGHLRRRPSRQSQPLRLLAGAFDAGQWLLRRLVICGACGIHTRGNR